MTSRPDLTTTESATEPTVDTSLRALFAGRRGRLLAGLLLAELAGAIQVLAVSGVLPLAAQELDGRRLYGAVVVAAPLTSIAVLLATPKVLSRLGAPRTLLVATVVYIAGVTLSAAAPAMVVVLIGSVLRGLAAGLLGGFGLSALGGLFEDELRPRVWSLFAVVWLGPSLLGPVANAVVAAAVGWRWALAWPVVLVCAARALIWRDARLVPVSEAPRRVDVLGGGILVGGLSLASAAPVLPPQTRSAAVVLGAATAMVATLRLVRRLVGPPTYRQRFAEGLVGLSAAFFGLQGIVSLAVLDAIGAGIGVSSVALGAGMVCWSLTGLCTTRGVGGLESRRPARGSLLVGAGAVGMLVAVLVPAPTAVAVAVAVGAFAVAGLGMGIAYPLVSSGPFEGVGSGRVSDVAAGVELAESCGAVLGAVSGAGVFSSAVATGVRPAAAVAVAAAATSLWALVTSARLASGRSARGRIDVDVE